MTITTTQIRPIAPLSEPPASLALILGLWFLVSLALGSSGVYSSVDGLGALAMPVAIVAPVILFVLGLAGSRRLRELLLGIDTRVLVLLHTWRMVGLGFLMLYAYDLLPAIFAFPAGLGDAAAAIWALVLGVGLYGGFRVSRRHLLAWNSFGLADFVIAVSIGSLSRYGFLHALTGTVSMSAMGQFPLVLIPTFIVPLLAITHIIVFLQVSKGRATGAE